MNKLKQKISKYQNIYFLLFCILIIVHHDKKHLVSAPVEVVHLHLNKCEGSIFSSFAWSVDLIWSDQAFQDQDFSSRSAYKHLVNISGNYLRRRHLIALQCIEVKLIDSRWCWFESSRFDPLLFEANNRICTTIVNDDDENDQTKIIRYKIK